MGKPFILRKQISDHLQKQRPNSKEVHIVDDCDVILVLCPIVSRAGTDIDAALNKLNTCSGNFKIKHQKVYWEISRNIHTFSTI